MLKFWELSPSPNNTKVRMALRFKGIDFETVPVDPFDRAPVVEVSGQELTPVIQDRGIVLNDSEAILQYLDANNPDKPRLLPGSREGRRECEAWQRKLDETVAAHWLPGFLYCIGLREDLDEESVARFQQALAVLNDEVGDRTSFKDDPEMAVCDLRVAEWATYALPGEGLVRRVGLFKKFRDVFGVTPGSLPNLERFLEPWNERLA
jgi:glutathione S-transferase